jgi:DMSO/TMAO reductase YedYZ heme-binding membrane subunit
MADSSAEEIFGFIFIVLGVILLVLLVIAAVSAFATVGALFGSGVAIKNYVMAFYRNVRPQQVET